MKGKLEKALNLILPIVTVLTVILAWAIAAKAVDSEYILPSVSKTVEEFLALLKSLEFYRSFAFTLLRSLIAFIFSFALAFALATLSVKLKYARKIISPIISKKLVVQEHSHATLEFGSRAKYASKIASEIISQILSGCPSVTDSDVKNFLIFPPF